MTLKLETITSIVMLLDTLRGVALSNTQKPGIQVAALVT